MRAHRQDAEAVVEALRAARQDAYERAAKLHDESAETYERAHPLWSVNFINVRDLARVHRNAAESIRSLAKEELSNTEKET